MARRPLPLRFSTALGALLLAATAAGPLLVTPSHAAWPPPEDATAEDMKKPDYWPDDPDYGWNAAEEKEGQWNYYSFMVDPNEAREEEKATGMSIDLAWRLTATEMKDGTKVAGHPSVLIGITDSGINWDEDDLIEAAYINVLELGSHRPTRADGSACDDLDPAFYLHVTAEAEAFARFDCNGDGILTVADYAETSSLTPEASEGRPLGDRDFNGRLDAGDLIANLSDGIDDDENGYVDDISGWDFFKDDNDPYDDTRYGHGTGEGKDSTARANNGIGGAGGCNGCRMLQLRVGDSFITDVTDFAQGVVYATDMKARVVQSALGTVNMNKFAQQALDYAFANGVLTVASMADENSRHHNMPTAANHTMPVHAIQHSSDSIFESRTFLEFHPCSNFGGQNYLSASGNGCSSEAVGQTSGIAGLVMSADIKYDRGLSGAEAMQLVMMTADDIDVPESRQPGAEDKWSQPGFDQRFGYGRINASTAVEWVRDGKIPPEVDVVSPTWFTVLYKDQVVGPVDIMGSIAAKRANSYDWRVEWAPGVQPLEEAFKVIARGENVDSDVVIGQDGPLASLDIRAIDPKHERDVDSPMGENDYTITVRVRAIARYDGLGEVPAEIRRTYYVHSDPDLARGFPVYVGAGGEGSPKMADIDGDGTRDIIYPTAAGELYVLKLTPSGPENVPGFPFKTEPTRGMAVRDGEPSYLDGAAYVSGGVDLDVTGEAISTNAPAIADIDQDGRQEIVITTYSGTIYVIEHDGTVKAGWPVRLPDVPSCSREPEAPTEQPCMGALDGDRYAAIDRGAFGAPVLADMNADGRLDIIQAAFDGKVYVFDGDGEMVPGWPVEVRYEGDLSTDPGPARIFTTPAVSDFDGDGLPDILVGSNQALGNGGNSGAVYLLDGRGTSAPRQPFPNWPITFVSFNLFPLVAEGVTNSGVVGTVDGQKVAIAHGNASSPVIVPLDPGGQTSLGRQPLNGLPQRPDPNDPTLPYQGVDPSSIFGPLSTAEQPNTMLPLFSQPSLADMDQDGTPDVIATGGSLNLALSLANGDSRPGGNLMAMWSLKTGQMLPAAPIAIEDFTFLNSSASADLTGDGYPEALVGTGGYFLHAVDACGREPAGWPKFTGQWIINTPAIGDVDGDGTLEVALGTRDGWLYLWHTSAPVTNVIPWESYHHDNRNTGDLDVALDQGGPPTAKKPLTAEVCTEEPVDGEVEPTYGASGGCACEAAGAPSRRGPLGALAVGALALVVYRRRCERVVPAVASISS